MKPIQFCMLLFSLSTSAPSLAQSGNQLIYNAEQAIRKADSLHSLGNFNLMAFYDSFALNAASKINQPEYSGRAYFLHAKYLASVQNYKEANRFYQNALQVYYKQQNNETTAQIYNDMGFSYGETGAADKQVESYLQAIKIYERHNDPNGLAQSMSNLSTAYFELEKDDRALEYAFYALRIREKQGDQRNLSLSYGNIANMYAQTGADELAGKYIGLGMTAAEKSGDKERMAQMYFTKALLLNKENKVQEALEMELKAIAILESLKNYGLAANRYIAAAFYSNKLGDTANAHHYFNKSIALASSIENKTVLRNGHNYLSDFYLEHRHYKEALEQYKKFIALRDSISNSETNTRIAQLQAAFDLEKKDFEINKLQVQQKIKQLEIEKQQALIAGNTAEAERKQNEIDLLSKTKELQEENLLRQHEELEKQKLVADNNGQKLLLAEKEKIIREKQIKGQSLIRNLLLGLTALLILLAWAGFNRYKLKKKLEQQASIIKMRNNISENLHDDIGATLSNINILNQLARNNIANATIADGYLEKSIEDIQQVSESISDIVWSINPQYDDLAQLLVRMKRYAADMLDGKSIQYHIRFDEQVNKTQLDMDKRRNFYLFYKEAVNNLVKHSGATQAGIDLFIKNNELFLHIKDNGAGFDAGNKKQGNGLGNMQKRAASLSGKLSIKSIEGKGTDVLLQFPVT